MNLVTREIVIKEELDVLYPHLIRNGGNSYQLEEIVVDTNVPIWEHIRGISKCDLLKFKISNICGQNHKKRA